MSARDMEITRLAELAVERWLEGLEPPQSIEFETLRARHPGFAIDSFEEVAAALRVDVPASSGPLPEGVRLKLARGADEYFGPRRVSSAVAFDEMEAASPGDRRWWVTYGGWLTAAASILLSLALLAKRHAPVESAASAVPQAAAPSIAPAPLAPFRDSIDLAKNEAEAAEQKETTPDRGQPEDAALERAQFMKTHAWLVQRAWLAGPDPSGEGVSGDIVWDPTSQTGYMRFHRLRRNDPNVEQYQLWIFDARRDQRFPVDGGVFNVDATGEQVVRFTARLSVEVPLMFVVTVERRGGVVVSDRSRISAIAHTS